MHQIQNPQDPKTLSLNAHKSFGKRKDVQKEGRMSTGHRQNVNWLKRLRDENENTKIEKKRNNNKQCQVVLGAVPLWPTTQKLGSSEHLHC